MNQITNDQYHGLSKLEKWYRKYSHQIIDISGIVGTGIWDMIQAFLDNEGFDPREVMYLSYDQKQVLELAYKRYHAYYINGIIYRYMRIVDFDSLPVINPHSTEILYHWEKFVRKKIDPRYRIMVVFDSSLMNESTLTDLASFGLPIILIRDPMLLPAPDTYTFMRDPNIMLREINPLYGQNPITYFAHKIITGSKIRTGSYDTVSVVTRKEMNLYNLKSADMVLAASSDLSQELNQTYRSKVLHRQNSINIPGERVIVTDNMYAHKITNQDEKNIKIYLTKGVVGNISKINRHAASTRYVPIDFKPEFYNEAFTELMLDRFQLNNIEMKTRQIVPDEIIHMEYAYALSSSMARLSHWDKVTMILNDGSDDPDLSVREAYTAITRARKSLTLVI